MKYTNKDIEVNEIYFDDKGKAILKISGIEKYSISEIREIIEEAFEKENVEEWYNNR